jgi:Protein of unknown function (DUF2892)
MTFNEGTWDRVIRVLVGLALGYAAWTTWPANASVVLLVLSAIATVTGIVGWCLVYALFDISSYKKKVRA